MRVVVEIECDNAAFSGHLFYGELHRVLSHVPKKVAEQRQRAPGCVCTAPEAADKLLDVNGNVVGFVRVDP